MDCSFVDSPVPGSSRINEVFVPIGLHVSPVSIPQRFSRFLPGRFVAKYSQAIPRFLHRAHVGFSLGHRTLDTAQEWQLSRILDDVERGFRRTGACEYDGVLGSWVLEVDSCMATLYAILENKRTRLV